MKKIIFSTVLSGFLLSSSLSAFSFFNVDIDQEIQANEKLIQKYEKIISKLKNENKNMLEAKAKNPQLFVKKPLYENLKDKYIYRIKLNGAKADAINFIIKDNMISVAMDMKYEEKSDNGYFYSSQQFSTSYSIPNDVKQEEIKHKIDGDYFVIIMPKK